MTTRLVQTSLLGSMPNGEDFATSFWAEINASDLSTYANDVAVAFNNSWGTSSSGNGGAFSTSFLMTGLRCSEVDQTSGAVTATIDIGLTKAGFDSNVVLPCQVALVASLRTAFAGRRNRGRMFWGGFTVNQSTTGGVPTSTCITKVGALTHDLLEVPTSSTYLGHPVIYSRVGRSTNIVINSAIGNKFDTMRRRANRRRETYTSTSV